MQGAALGPAPTVLCRVKAAKINLEHFVCMEVWVILRKVLQMLDTYNLVVLKKFSFLNNHPFANGAVVKIQKLCAISSKYILERTGHMLQLRNIQHRTSYHHMPVLFPVIKSKQNLYMLD